MLEALDDWGGCCTITQNTLIQKKLYPIIFYCLLSSFYQGLNSSFGWFECKIILHPFSTSSTLMHEKVYIAQKMWSSDVQRLECCHTEAVLTAPQIYAWPHCLSRLKHFHAEGVHVFEWLVSYSCFSIHHITAVLENKDQRSLHGHLRQAQKAIPPGNYIKHSTWPFYSNRSCLNAGSEAWTKRRYGFLHVGLR